MWASGASCVGSQLQAASRAGTSQPLPPALKLPGLSAATSRPLSAACGPAAAQPPRSLGHLHMCFPHQCAAKTAIWQKDWQNLYCCRQSSLLQIWVRHVYGCRHEGDQTSEAALDCAHRRLQPDAHSDDSWCLQKWPSDSQLDAWWGPDICGISSPILRWPSAR